MTKEEKKLKKEEEAKLKEEEKRKAEEQKRIHENLSMKDRLDPYKWIKFSQSLILIIMGILFMALANITSYTSYIVIAFSVTLLIYSVLEIFGALMLKKSILSTEIFVSLIIFAIALMVICNSSLHDASLLVWFFGILIAGYALILISSGVIALTIDANDEKYGTNKTKRITIAVLQFVLAGVLITLDILLWIFGLRKTEDSNILLIPMLIGVALIFMGGASMFYAFQAIKTQKFLAQETPLSNEVEDEKESDVQNSSKESNDDIITVDATTAEEKSQKKMVIKGKDKKD